jgi:hypothetical protein
MDDLLLMPPFLLPPVAWWAQVVASELPVVVPMGGHWRRQTLLSRCWIKAANGPLALTVPVVHPPQGTPWREVQIQQSSPWAKELKASLQSAFGKCPYYEELMPDFFAVVDTHSGVRPATLAALNLDMLRLCCQLLGLGARGIAFEDPTQPSNRFVDLHVKTYAPPKFAPQPYHQPFGPFAANLSVLDLLMNTGPEAVSILRKSWTLQ